MFGMAMPRFASVEVVLMIIEPPEAFTLTVNEVAVPEPAILEEIIISVVLPNVVGVPESTHILLSKRPEGRPVWLHEVNTLKPVVNVGERELIGVFCTMYTVPPVPKS